MRFLQLSRTLPLLAGAALIAGACSRDTSGLDPATGSPSGVVFTDAFGSGVSFQGFAGSNTNALHIDSTVKHTGIASLRITVPNVGDPAGGYSGGAFVSTDARDLTKYDALTFWAKASRAATLDVAGLGNDNTGTSKYTAQRNAIALTTDWQQVVIPIPLAAKLTAERGLFFLAEGPENGLGYDIWLDDVKFATLGTITNPRATLATATVTDEVGATRQLGTLATTFAVGGTDVTVDAAAGYFTFLSSAPTVATVDATGRVTAVGAGEANITASLGTTAATGTLTVRTVAPPAVGAPAPTRAAADVISLFSDAYTNRPVATWSASYDQADVADVTIAGNATKKYTNLVFSSAEFTSPTIDASQMTHLHMDVWVYDDAAFRVKLVDFGANGVFGGGDDTEHEVTLTPGSTPAVVKGQWNSIDIPFTSFTGLVNRGHLAQLILSGSSSTVYLDNIYFWKDVAPPPPSAPVTAAPTPTYTAANAISLFSNAYTNVAVDTWSASWDQADVTDLQVAGNATKKYTNLVFAGIEFTSAPIDASQMTNFRMDIWTPDGTTSPATFKVKLVDFGANGTFGGGDDVEHELAFTAATTPALRTGQWVTLDIPLSQFTGLTTKAHLAQLIISGDLRTVFVDNVLLHR